MKTKTCSRCKIEKEVTEFYTHPLAKDGYRWQCIACHQTYGKDPFQRKVWSHTYHIKTKTKRPEVYLFKQAKARAKNDYKCPFEITIEDVIIPAVCPYLRLKLDVFQAKDRSPSLDRIDPAKGYVKGNVQVISWKANRMKSNATIEELIEFAKGVLACHAKEG